MDVAAKIKFGEIIEGQVHHEKYVIDEQVFQGFVELFKDRSPIHVDLTSAREAGFDGQVMHGAILNGFLSQFVGMRFPGQTALLLSADIRYLKPSYLGDTIRLDAKVEQKVESQRVIILRVNFFNESRGHIVANGRVQVRVHNG